MKVFVIESPSPNNLLDGRNEADSIVNISKMFGHKAASFFVKNKNELDSVMKYITDVDASATDLYCYHFSCHGNDKGIAFGPDLLNWVSFAKAILPILKNKSLKDKSIIIISACGANEQKLTRKISKLDDEVKKHISPPSYIFVYDEKKVPWSDALLSWTILYHQLGKVKKIERSDMQRLLKKMKTVEFGKLIYFRWDEGKKKYLRFRPK
ncbi:MAG: hypothetical protein ABSD50_15525 [Smithella sp.]|jgi:hypothetical protein